MAELTDNCEGSSDDSHSSHDLAERPLHRLCQDPLMVDPARSALTWLAEPPLSPQVTPETRTDVTILRSAASVISDDGERNLTIDRVAERAGVSRVTVFRRFGNREKLLTATYGRELRLVLERILDAVHPAGTARDCAHIAVMQFIESAEAHPIFLRLLQVEPEMVIALSRGNPEFSGQEWGARLLTQLLSSEQLGDPLSEQDAGFIGTLLMRLVFSLLLIPDPAMLESAEARRQYLRRVVEQIVP